jgi:prepilin-type N-terminal cleavage/methylation domain-containing protein
MIRIFNKYNFRLTRYSRRETSKGVTLIELLVVISIFTILTTITIFNYGKFNSSLSIQNLADDIALTIRRAQGFAIGVRGSDENFSLGYGIHFTANPDTTDLSAGSNKSFILFADIANGANDTKGIYNHSGNTCGENNIPTQNNECIEILSITSSDIISAIYYNQKDQDHLVDSQNGGVDILFKRPNPEPSFCIRKNPGNTCDNVGDPISKIIIDIVNTRNADIIKTVIISNNGQISVPY